MDWNDLRVMVTVASVVGRASHCAVVRGKNDFCLKIVMWKGREVKVLAREGGGLASACDCTMVCAFVLI